MIWPSMPVEALEKLASHGWPALELSCEHLGLLARLGDIAIENFASTIKRLNVDVPQAHATITADVAALDPLRRAADMALIRRDIEICAALGIQNIVLHPGGTEACPDRATLEHLAAIRLESFATLAAICEEKGTRIAIENMSDGGTGVWGKRKFGAIAEELLGLIEEIASPALGICWDTSHANIQSLNQAEAIRACGDKLIALHISDNDGSGDQHRTPGYGNIDFASIISALREIGYTGNFNLEIPGENRAASEIVELRSRYALAVCQALLKYGNNTG